MKLLGMMLYLAAGMAIFVGLPMVAWGVRDAAGFFASPGRQGYVAAMVLLQVVTYFYTWPSFKRKEDRKSGVARHRLDLVVIQLCSIAVVVLAPWSDRHGVWMLAGGETARFAGLALMTPGFLLMQVAEKYLDRQFSVEVTVQTDHHLITSGPFRYIRHPRYLGLVMFFTGIALAFQSGLAFAPIGVLMVVLAWRITVEEALMRDEFGAAWDDYAARSWRLIPFLF